ncbi:Peptidyl-prolyl cis-trans isomerase FKBP62, partial [Bienertia sinuspersici]
DLKGDLCFSLFEEADLSSNSLFQIVCQLEKNQGIFYFVRGLKDEGISLYNQGLFNLAIEKYFLAIKVLPFFLITGDEEKHDFLHISISINLNLAACFLKEEFFFYSGSTLLYDSLEVVTILGWTKDYVFDALMVLNEDESFVNYTTNSGFDDEEVGSQSYIDGMLKPLEQECHTTPTEVNKKVVGTPLSVKVKVNPSTQDQRHNFLDATSIQKSFGIQTMVFKPK